MTVVLLRVAEQEPVHVPRPAAETRAAGVAQSAPECCCVLSAMGENCPVLPRGSPLTQLKAPL